jgi:hypothetical protein
VPQRLARPLYEALPLLWALAGIGCLAGSYAWRSNGFSGLLALVGLVLLVLAIAVWMHRRDYRATAAGYRLRGQPMPLPGPGADGGSRGGPGNGPGEGDPPATNA